MATTDIVTLAEARDYLNQQNLGNSPLLAAWITAASVAMDDACGPVVQRSVTDTFYDCGSWFVQLTQPPVASFSSVTEYDQLGNTYTLTAETATSKPGYGYLWKSQSSILQRRSSGVPYRFAGGHLVVVYTAGRFASTSAATPIFKQATLITLAHNWRNEHGTGNTFGEAGGLPARWSIPDRALQLLGSEVRVSRTLGIA